MTNLDITEHAYLPAIPTPRPRAAIALVAAVASLMSSRPSSRVRHDTRSRGSPVPKHLHRDVGLMPADDEWWRAIDRW
jgi:hypothetical protein